MYKITCECGKSEKNFKFNIGTSFRGECCKEEHSEDSNPADLNGDGVVDEKDAEILLSEISKGKKKKKNKKSPKSPDLDEYL